MKPILLILLVTALLLSACSQAVEPSATPTLTLQPSPATPTAIPPTETWPAPTETAAQPTRVVEDVAFELLGQSGGALTDFARLGDLVYLAAGPRLLVLEITSAGKLRSIYQSEPLLGTANDLAIDGNRLYWLTGDAGLLVFDLADPRLPVLTGVKLTDTATKKMAAADGQGYFAAWDCVAQGMAGESECQARLTSSPLDDLQSLGGGGLDVPAPVQDLHIVDQTLFLVHPMGVLSFDLSDPANPSQLDEYTSEPISAHAFAGGMLYLFNEGLTALDLSDPANLKPAGETVPGEGYYYINSAAANERRLFGFSTFGEFGVCTSNLVVYDISDPAQPALLTPIREDGGQDGTLLSLRCADQAAAQGRWLLTHDWSGLNLVDLAGAPRLADTLAAPAAPDNLTVQDGIAYWGDALVDRSLNVLDLRDPAAPLQQGSLPPQWASRMAAAPGELYAPVWQDGLKILSLTDPLAPEQLSQLSAETLGGGASLGAHSGDILYLNLDGERIQAVDVSDPAAPALLGNYRPACDDGNRQLLAAAAAPQRLFLLRGDCEDDQALPFFEMVNAADPAALSWLSNLALPVGGERFDLAASGDLVLTTAYPWSESRASGELLLIDASSVESPQVAARLVVPGTLMDVQIADGYAYIAAGQEGVWAVDISDPGGPFLAGRVNTPGDASAVAIEDGKLYVADGAGGVAVYSIESK